MINRGNIRANDDSRGLRANDDSPLRGFMQLLFQHGCVVICHHFIFFKISHQHKHTGKYMNTKPNRQTIRLKQHDYTSGCSYFITICTHNRSHLFGEIVDGSAVLNDTGKKAHQCWLQIPNHFPNAKIDNFIIMPNHIHGIIHMQQISPVGANHYSPVFCTTNNQTNFPDKFIIQELQPQNVKNYNHDNDGDLYENDGCGFARGLRVDDDLCEMGGE
jgi:hypothetical protein